MFNRAWRRKHEVREAVAAKQEEPSNTVLTTPDGERRVLTNREAQKQRNKAPEVRRVIDRKTWKAMYRSKRWPPGNGAQEMARRVRQADKWLSKPSTVALVARVRESLGTPIESAP
jgi:hypothetical protein